MIAPSILLGTLFGALAVENGLTVLEAVLMTTTIYAGASQLVGLELFSQKAAPWLIVLSMLIVNIRLFLYSAVVGRLIHSWTTGRKLLAFFLLVDQVFGETERRAEMGRPITFAWYLGLGIPPFFSWVIATFVGAFFGQLLNDAHSWGIDFLLPINFLGMVMSFRGRSHWASIVMVSAFASIVADKALGSPWHVSFGATAGIILAVLLAPAKQKTRSNKSSE